MDTLKHLNLTERDFQLMVDGLDALPRKNDAGEMFSDLMIGMLSKDENAMDKVRKERESKLLKKQREQQLLVEDIRILQGKLLMLKRYLMEQGAMNETQNIINHIS